MKIKKLEKLFLVLNACLAGLGTAAGFAFPSLAFLVALFGATGAALLSLSIGGIVVFSILALLIGSYFFYTTFKNSQEIANKVKDKQEMMLDVLIDYVLYQKKNGEHTCNTMNAKKYSDIQAIIKDIHKISSDLSTNINEKSRIMTIKEILKKKQSFKKNLKSYQQSLIQQFKNKPSFFLDSPTLRGSASLFMGYGSILGPSGGVIGVISGIGIISGMSAIASPILIAIVFISIALALLTAYLTYYSESRNAERFFIINETDNLIDDCNSSIRNIFICLDHDNRINVTPDKNPEDKKEWIVKRPISMTTPNPP